MREQAEEDGGDRDDRRLGALRRTLRSFAAASRRARADQSPGDARDAALEAHALERVARAIVSDDDADDEPSQ